MKFVLPESILQGADSQKVSKNLLKKFENQVALPKSGLATPGTSSPLGIN
jgi:hypothetical protein